MQINDDLIARLEDISCLALSDSEKKLLKSELQEIVDSLALFNELDTQGIPECANPLDNVNFFREDKAYPSFDRELILKNAPVKNEEMFIAPKTVE